ncbi:hypothetical protein RH915_07855 [Serpentinicella sp. ANB-PHB4]|uniref:hypothetical protein n=1 Tax=Serpentinicella sp. ANB-PHB4 TaxID=3074076 RepID=UPI00285F311F|nr:hypothetical protein [Serpentinicella sp. ANB-PHB4]MDR5659402.1 hypothetical protein [Serpentinicella sp. ANB-PHB4]
MLSIIQITIIGLFSYILWSILFGALNQSVLQLFVPIQKKTNKLKGKTLYRILPFIIFLTIMVSLDVGYQFGDFVFGLIIGCFLALNDAIFDELMTGKLNAKK